MAKNGRILLQTILYLSHLPCVDVRDLYLNGSVVYTIECLHIQSKALHWFHSPTTSSCCCVYNMSVNKTEYQYPQLSRGQWRDQASTLFPSKRSKSKLLKKKKILGPIPGHQPFPGKTCPTWPVSGHRVGPHRRFPFPKTSQQTLKSTCSAPTPICELLNYDIYDPHNFTEPNTINICK